MSTYTPTYRYGVIMAETLAEVKDILYSSTSGNPNAETGAGTRTYDMPCYGESGDYADVYIVRRDDPDFSEVLDEPGDRARHAHGWLAQEPTYRFTFGPRGGLSRDTF